MQTPGPVSAGNRTSSSSVLLPAREALRVATKDIHDRLHGHMLFRQLLEETITRQQYTALLSRLYGFHQGIEIALGAQDTQHRTLPMGPRRRVHLLAYDLKTLGQSDNDISELPVAKAPPGLDQVGRFLGCLYVREGATLGGRVLAGTLAHLLGSGLEGRRFFAGTKQDPELWRACCTALEQPMEMVEREEMITAAQETFEIFEQWMSVLDVLAPVGVASQ